MTSIQNKNNISTFRGKSNEGGTRRNVLGVLGGTATGFALFEVGGITINAYMKSFAKSIDKFTPQENNQLFEEAEQIVKDSGIKEKGFNGIIQVVQNKKEEIEYPEYTETNFDSYKDEDIIKELLKSKPESPDIEFKPINIHVKKLELPKSDPMITEGTVSLEKALSEIQTGSADSLMNGPFSTRLKIGILKIAEPLEKISNLLIGNFAKKNLKGSVMLGCYDSLTNRVFAGKQASLLHEVGHAINRNKNFFTKIPLNLLLLSKSILIPLAILMAIFTKKPDKAGDIPKEKPMSQKIKEFIHNHIGLTVAGLFIPLLLEEGMASSRAIKFANASKVLAESTKKQHNKCLNLAYGSYLLGTVLFSSTVQAVVSVKDKIQTPKPSKKD